MAGADRGSAGVRGATPAAGDALSSSSTQSMGGVGGACSSIPWVEGTSSAAGTAAGAASLPSMARSTAVIRSGNRASGSSCPSVRGACSASRWATAASSGVMTDDSPLSSARASPCIPSREMSMCRPSSCACPAGKSTSPVAAGSVAGVSRLRRAPRSAGVRAARSSSALWDGGTTGATTGVDTAGGTDAAGTGAAAVGAAVGAANRSVSRKSGWTSAGLGLSWVRNSVDGPA